MLNLRMLSLCITAYVSIQAVSSLDDLLIKNSTDKSIGIIWFLGDNYTEKGFGNLLSPAILAPHNQTIPGDDPYLPNSDTKALKKNALQSIMSSKKPVTGALFFDVNNMEDQRIVKFADFVTGTVKRDGAQYKVHSMTIIAPPAYKTEQWQVIKGFDVQPDTYNK